MSVWSVSATLLTVGQNNLPLLRFAALGILNAPESLIPYIFLSETVRRERNGDVMGLPLTWDRVGMRARNFLKGMNMVDLSR